MPLHSTFHDVLFLLLHRHFHFLLLRFFFFCCRHIFFFTIINFFIILINIFFIYFFFFFFPCCADRCFKVRREQDRAQREASRQRMHLQRDEAAAEFSSLLVTRPCRNGSMGFLTRARRLLSVSAG